MSIGTPTSVQATPPLSKISQVRLLPGTFPFYSDLLLVPGLKHFILHAIPRLFRTIALPCMTNAVAQFILPKQNQIGAQYLMMNMAETEKPT